MEEKLGLAYSVIKRKMDMVGKEIYDRDLNRLERYNYLEPKNSIYIIFASVPSNRMPTTFYIGKTSQTIKKRFDYHLRDIKAMIQGKKTWQAKYAWMNQIITNGGNLVIYELNKVQKSAVYVYENMWIDYLRSCEFKLLNKNNSKYINKKILEL